MTSAAFTGYSEAHRGGGRWRRRFFALSASIHLLLLAGITLAPLWRIEALPAPSLVVTLYDTAAPPPPPPPAPPAAGGGSDERSEPQEALVEPEKAPETLPEPQEQASTEAPPQEGGLPNGIAGGEEGGVEGGVAGGVEGGVVGGVLGGVLGGELAERFLVKPQKRLRGRDPAYPPHALAARLSALVSARICIDSSGRVSGVTILSGRPPFDQAVRDATRDWQYEPYRPGRSAVPACFPVYFNFKPK